MPVYRGWDGTRYSGANFAAQDYLGLAQHPEVVEAAPQGVGDIWRYGAGSEVNGGTTPPAEARTTLKRVFAKTGVSRQSELAALLSSLVLQ